MDTPNTLDTPECSNSNRVKISRNCKYENCDVIRPSYNYPDRKNPIYCKTHAAMGMIDVRSKQCHYEDCKKRSIFGYSTDLSPIYCGKHKLSGMKNFNKRTCINDECNKPPRYNIVGSITGEYCKIHKTLEMEVINIRGRGNGRGRGTGGKQDVNNFKKNKCHICGKKAMFNSMGENEGLTCRKHKEDGMVNIYRKCYQNNDIGRSVDCDYIKTERLLDANEYIYNIKKANIPNIVYILKYKS